MVSALPSLETTYNRLSPARSLFGPQENTAPDIQALPTKGAIILHARPGSYVWQVEAEGFRPKIWMSWEREAAGTVD